ncbi:hypothetical protein [Brevibacterium salitolerans]
MFSEDLDDRHSQALRKVIGTFSQATVRGRHQTCGAGIPDAANERVPPPVLRGVPHNHLQFPGGGSDHGAACLYETYCCHLEGFGEWCAEDTEGGAFARAAEKLPHRHHGSTGG